MVETETSTYSYVGNNSTETAYSFPAPFLALAHIEVSVRDEDGDITELVQGSDYTVTGIASGGAFSSGSVVTDEAVPATSTVIISRNTPRKQDSEFNDGGPLPGSAIENSLDRNIMIVQEQERVLGRLLRVDLSSPEQDELTAIPSGILAFDTDSQLETVAPDDLIALLNLPETVIDLPQKVFADDAGRAAAVPDFIGQVGVQNDTKDIYIAGSLTAGDWDEFGTDLLDEDDFASDSATQAPTQQSAKAYIDAAITALRDQVDPIGIPKFWETDDLPDSDHIWLAGQELSRTTYADYFAVVGETFGVGDGSTTFNARDMRGLVPVGRDDMGGTAADRVTDSGTGNPGLDGTELGAIGGADRITQTEAQMPEHNHAQESRSTMVEAGSSKTVYDSAGGFLYSVSTGDAGDGEAMPNLQPSTIVQFIARVR